MDGRRIRVRVAVVTHPYTNSPIRRNIYSVLSRNAVRTDIGWILPDKEDVLRRLAKLSEEARSKEGVEGVSIYEVWLSSEEHKRLLSRVRKRKREKA